MLTSGEKDYSSTGQSNEAKVGIGLVNYVDATIRLDNIAAELFQLPEGVSIALHRLLDSIHPDDFATMGEWCESGFSADRRQLKGRKIRVFRKHDECSWLQVSEHADIASSMRSDMDSRGLLTVVDITAAERERHDLQLAFAEQRHRTKNILAIVGNIAKNLLHTGDFEQFHDRFSRQLRSLALSIDTLARSHAHAVPLNDLMSSQLAAFQGPDRSQIRISGPRIAIASGAVTFLGVALYELASNAAKYGALSNLNGCVNATWELTTESADRLLLTWQELGGPMPTRPQHQGFGLKMLQESLPVSLGGDVKLEFRPEGFFWQISCPTERVCGPNVSFANPLPVAS